jgi:ribonuclease HI
MPGGRGQPAVDTEYSAACVYGTDGRCVGQVDPARLHYLYSNYQHIRRTQPKLCDQLGCGTFEEEMYRLVMRYKNAKETTPAGQVHPPGIMRILTRHLGVRKQRLSSPLACDLLVTQYWSAHERDQLFGASWDGYGCQWTGYSECDPDHTPTAMEKAVRWAVHSASAAHEPTATVLILPSCPLDSATAYTRWVRDAPEYCHELVKINASCYRHGRTDAWKGGPKLHDHRRHGMTVLLVANEAAFQSLNATADPGAFLADLTAAANALHGTGGAEAGAIRWFCDRAVYDGRQRLAVPDRFGRLPGDTTHLAWQGPPITCRADILARFQPQHNLLMDWRRMVYTDGSVAKGADGSVAAGSGIYRPGAEGVEAMEVKLDPAGSGMTNTINRAELAPILHAIESDLGDTIATDSACSLYQIAGYLKDPNSKEWHKHRPLLELLAAAITARCQQGKPLHLVKVNAHCGIVGNEMADELARCAGGTMEDIDQCPAPATTPMHRAFWPVRRAQHTEGGTTLQHMPDLRTGLKAHLRRHGNLRLGYSNLDSIYFQAWQAIVPIAHAASNGFARLPKGVEPTARKLTWHARFGTLNTAKFRMRCGLAASDACLLCGAPDGGHHSLSGCSHMMDMYTRRHNEAGGIIYRALLKGGLGAAVIMQDIGRHNAVADGGRLPPTVGTRLPPELAALMEDAEVVSRPDILIAHNTCTPGLAQIHLVEVKYCRDTDRRRQHEAAESQHETLLRRLRRTYSGNIQLHIITLGVAGTVYTDFIETMEAMQVPRQEAQRCAAKLHAHAVAYVQRIMGTKWSQERASRQEGAG